MKKDIVRSQIRIEESDHKMLRKLAYLKKKSINTLMQEGIKEYLKKEKELLKNADIVVT
jgi:predicted HicB family RNase H-like nuclease